MSHSCCQPRWCMNSRQAAAAAELTPSGLLSGPPPPAPPPPSPPAPQPLGKQGTGPELGRKAKPGNQGTTSAVSVPGGPLSCLSPCDWLQERGGEMKTLCLGYI